MKAPGLSYSYLDSPVGRLLLAGNGDALHYLSFPGGHKAFGPDPSWSRDDSVLRSVKASLDAYFGGRTRSFDLPLVMRGTPFQKKVWQVLRTIPYGETRSYRWLAETVGNPAASRAVGAANGANPIPIIVPCHRVIGANGALTGFGGGIDTKRFLLELEAGR